MKKNQLFIMLIAASMLAITSCSEHPGYKKTNTGLYYKFHVRNDNAQKPQLGDVLTVDMQYKVEGKDTSIFNSKKMPEPSRLMLVKPMYKGDISEGLALMAQGDSATFIISADSFYLKNVGMKELPKFIKQGDKLFFDIKIKSIQKKEDFEKEQKMKMEKMKALVAERKTKEPEELQAYLKANSIYARPTTTGLYYIETKTGYGARAEKGKTVKVNYTGKLFDGTIFDSSVGKDPIQFVLGEGKVIPGWEEGIAMMRVGGTAKFIIPSSLAYGERGAGAVIMPYTSLVFEVELLDVK